MSNTFYYPLDLLSDEQQLPTVKDESEVINPSEVNEFNCMDTDNIVTPINTDLLAELLQEINFDPVKTRKLVKGFRHGFSIGYKGPMERISMTHNLPFRIGTPLDMWNKIMKEVKLERYAGPFLKSQIPYQHFVQSPIGLVPKARGRLDSYFICHMILVKNHFNIR